jgi:iron complex outermembrane receptor protein
VSVIALSASGAFAQALDEVVVTAQKRTQSVQDVPISINAISGDAIDKAGVTDVNGIVDLVPGLNSRSDGPTQTVFAMRGVGTNAFGVGVDGSVGVFVDDVYIGHPVLVNTSFFDVERVEVVKGPQGTLFGRNTSAGAISAASKGVDLDEGSRITLGGGNEGQQSVQFTTNQAITDKLGIRLAARVQERDGTYTNTTTGHELNNVDNQIVRLVADYEMSDATSVNLVLENYTDSSYWGMIDTGDNRSFEAESVTQAARGDVDIDSTRMAFKLTHDLGDNKTLVWNLNQLDITSVTTPGDFLPAGGANILVFSEPGDFEFFSTELRLNGSSDGMDWFVGASYRDDTLFNNSTLSYNIEDLGAIFDGNDPQGGAVDTNETSPTTAEVTAYAVYGDVSFDVSDRLSATLGARYSNDEKDIDVQVDAVGAQVLKPIAGSATASDDWSETTGRFALNYELDDGVMAYASYAQGYKAGGFNSSLNDDGNVLAVEPETHDAIELGVKSELMDRRLRLNAAYFSSEYKDTQIEVQQGTAFVIRNIADADISGFELDGIYAASENLDIQFAVSSLDTEITAGILPTDTDGDGAVDTQVNVAGNDMPFAPELSYTLGLNYSQTTSWVSLVLVSPFRIRISSITPLIMMMALVSRKKTIWLTCASI